MKNRVILLCIAFFALLTAACKTINQQPEKIGFPPGVVVFTFDDGPNIYEDTTGRLLEVLHKYDICAMFALLGENAQAAPELVKHIYDEGHYLINHGYSDKWAARMKKDEFRINLEDGEKAIDGALEAPLFPRLYRPQGGFYKNKHLRLCREYNYQIVPVTARAYDAVLKPEDKEKAVKRLIDDIKSNNGGIVLLHDARDSGERARESLAQKPDGAFNRSWIPGAVEEIIITLQQAGFKLNGFDTAEVMRLEIP
jgi:peptidoglycan/xylan/chitin deacetylase (PgdA/CDA1 family)